MGEAIMEDKEFKRIFEKISSYDKDDEIAVLEYMRSNPHRIQDLTQSLADQFPGQPIHVSVKLGSLLEEALRN